MFQMSACMGHVAIFMFINDYYPLLITVVQAMLCKPVSLCSCASLTGLIEWCVSAVIAMLVPFFNDVVGLLGALGFWPLTVFLPIQMHLKQAGLLLMTASYVLPLCQELDCQTLVCCAMHLPSVRHKCHVASFWCLALLCL